MPQPGRQYGAPPLCWSGRLVQPGWPAAPAKKSKNATIIVVAVVQVIFVVGLLIIASVLAILFGSGSITDQLSQTGNQLDLSSKSTLFRRKTSRSNRQPRGRAAAPGGEGRT
jgi:hypothetical protein